MKPMWIHRTIIFCFPTRLTKSTAPQDWNIMKRKKSWKKEQEEHKVSAECQKLIDEGQAYVRHIRECNDAIPGEEISRKLDKMEQLVQRIFDEVGFIRKSLLICRK